MIINGNLVHVTSTSAVGTCTPSEVAAMNRRNFEEGSLAGLNLPDPDVRKQAVSQPPKTVKRKPVRQFTGFGRYS